jgi:hypothetical protein
VGFGVGLGDATEVVELVLELPEVVVVDPTQTVTDPPAIADPCLTPEPDELDEVQAEAGAAKLTATPKASATAIRPEGSCLILFMTRT